MTVSWFALFERTREFKLCTQIFSEKEKLLILNGLGVQEKNPYEPKFYYFIQIIFFLVTFANRTHRQYEILHQGMFICVWASMVEFFDCTVHNLCSLTVENKVEYYSISNYFPWSNYSRVKNELESRHKPYVEYAYFNSNSFFVMNWVMKFVKREKCLPSTQYPPCPCNTAGVRSEKKSGTTKWYAK